MICIDMLPAASSTRMPVASGPIWDPDTSDPGSDHLLLERLLLGLRARGKPPAADMVRRAGYEGCPYVPPRTVRGLARLIMAKPSGRTRPAGKRRKRKRGQNRPFLTVLAAGRHKLGRWRGPCRPARFVTALSACNHNTNPTGRSRPGYSERRGRTRERTMFAVIKTGGKQYRVAEDQVLKVEGSRASRATSSSSATCSCWAATSRSSARR